jgi:hypothetical protein
VPVYQIQGLTDPLFPPVQALMLRNTLLDWNPHYPISSFFGDVGHSNANNPADVWAVANARANAFFDYYLRGAGTRPAADVTAMTTDCVAGQTRQTFEAPSWSGLSTGTLTLSSGTPQVTSNASAGPEGPATDPIVHSGCLSASPVEGTGVASWSFAVTQPQMLMGQPTLTVSFLPTGIDSEFDVRLWDVSPDGSSETLVSRGTYRALGTAGAVMRVTFQTSGNAWLLQPQHTLRVEITGNDSPYYQADNLPSVVTITALKVSLPVRS